MARATVAYFVGVAATMLTASLSAQPTCTYPQNTTNQNTVAFNWQSHFIELSRLGTHWMPSFGNGDSMTRPLRNPTALEFPFGSTGLRETWYLAAADDGANRAPYYALYSSGSANHMDAPTTGGGGYVLDLANPLGYGWTDDLPGMAPMTRYLNGSIFDHRTWLPCPNWPTCPSQPGPPGYNLDAVWDLTTNFPTYGYPRLGGGLTACDVRTLGDQLGTVMENGTLRIRFNPVWGNAISELTYLPGSKQLVDHAVGDMLQASIFYESVNLNPTWAGGAACGDYGENRLWAGSPIISTEGVTGTDVKRFTSTVRPLNFCHDQFTDSDQEHPLAWRGEYKMTTTLGCFLGTTPTLANDVLKIEFAAKTDVELGDVSAANMRNGAWFLNDVFGPCANGLTVELVDLGDGEILQTLNLDCDAGEPLDQAMFEDSIGRGIRVTSDDTGFAVGFVRLGLIDHLVVWSRCNSLPACADRNLVLGAMTFHNLNSSTWTTDEAFYVLGSPSDVLDRLVAINADGGDCLQ